MRLIGGMVVAGMLALAGGAAAEEAKPKYPPYPEVWGRVLPGMPDPAVNRGIDLGPSTSVFPTPDGDRELWFKWWTEDDPLAKDYKRLKFFGGESGTFTLEEWFARHEAWRKSAPHKRLERALTAVGFGPNHQRIRGTFWEPRSPETRMPAVVLPPGRDVITRLEPRVYYEDKDRKGFHRATMGYFCTALTEINSIFVRGRPVDRRVEWGRLNDTEEPMVWRKVLVRILDTPKPTVEDECRSLAAGGKTPFTQRVEVLTPWFQPLEDGTFLLFPIPSGDSKEFYAVRFRDRMESPFLEGRKDLAVVDAALVEPILLKAEHLYYTREYGGGKKWNGVSPFQYAHDALYRLATGKNPE